MTARAFPRHKTRRRSRTLLPALAVLVVVVVAGAALVSYLLWPTWPKTPVALDAPAIPVTVAGVLFNLPPAAIRANVQRLPGAHERIDLVFLWPSLLPPPADDQGGTTATAISEDGDVPVPRTDDRFFVTVAGLGAVLPPAERLRTIYPRYVEGEATAGPDGLAVLPFRSSTPYEGEDLVYLIEKPEQFFLRCSRPVHMVPGTCTQERLLDAAEISLRFPRQWIEDWRSVASGFDRLLATIHPQGR